MSGMSSAGPLLARVLPWHLAVAWSTVALLYVAHPSWLPSPLAAFLLSTVIGAAAAGLLVATAGPRPEPNRTKGRTSAPGRTPEPVVAAGPVVVPRPVAVSPPVDRPISDVDLADVERYPSATAAEQQCPRCGGFEVQAGAPGWVRCRTCVHAWRPDQESAVAVRSWLHQR